MTVCLTHKICQFFPGAARKVPALPIDSALHEISARDDSQISDGCSRRQKATSGFICLSSPRTASTLHPNSFQLIKSGLFTLSAQVAFLNTRFDFKMVQISEVKGNARDNRTFAHTHIKGLGLRQDGTAERQAAGFVGQAAAREVRKLIPCCMARR